MAFENTRRFALPVAVLVTLCAVGAQLGAARLSWPAGACEPEARAFALQFRVGVALVNSLVLFAAWALSRRRWVVVLLALMATAGAAAGHVAQQKLEHETRC